jgi:predicted DNA-binding transcriptional regulator AlpA
MNRKTEEDSPLDREQLLTAREAADFLRVSISWLAKSRMRGDGPAFLKIGRGVRYRESALLQWLKSQQRLSTSER